MSSPGQYIQFLSASFASGSPDQVGGALAPLLSGHGLSSAQAALSPIPLQAFTAAGVAPYIGQISPDSRDGFTAFIVALLGYVKQAPPSSTGDFEQSHGHFSRLVGLYNEANKLYGTTSGDGRYVNAHLIPVILALAKELVRVSQYTASLSTLPPRDSRSPRSIRDTTRQTIERSMQIASTSFPDAEWYAQSSQPAVVGDLIWPLANILWRIYAARKLHTQAAELIKTFSSLTPAEDKRLSSRSRAVKTTEVCQSYYWRGRLGVVLLEMRNARYWLDKAWRTCPQQSYQQNRAILLRLIPINLLLGILPSTSMLRAYNLVQFFPLLQAFRTGNIAAWRKELEQQREWYRRRSIWLILYERGEILVWRTLFRNSLRAYYLSHPEAPRGRCPTWVFLQATQLAFAGTGEAEDGDIVLEDIICVLSSLIDQSLVLGHLSYSQQFLVMKPSPDGMGGFPKVSTVVPRRVEAVS